MGKEIKFFLERLGLLSQLGAPYKGRAQVYAYMSARWFVKQFFVVFNAIAIIELLGLVNHANFAYANSTPFLFFVISYIVGYIVAESLIFGFKHVGKYNALFHIGFFVFGLNFVSLFAQHHLLYTTPIIYTSVGSLYVFFLFFRGVLGPRAYYYCAGLLFLYFSFYIFYMFDAFLIFSNVVIYKTARRARWVSIRYPHITLYPSFWPAKHNVSLFYRNFSDTTFFWDHSVWFQIFFNICAVLVVFLFFSSIYSRLASYAVGSHFLLHYIYLAWGVVLSFLVIYSVFGVFGSINFATFLSPAKSVYPFMISFVDQLDYKTYLLFFGYAAVIIILLRVALASFRWLVLSIVDRPFIVDVDYKSMVRAIYYRRHPMFWKFPRRWFKVARFGRKRKIPRSRHAPLPEDAVFFYGGPNPHMVLFNGVTGEVKPIFVKDLIAENYRVYYKFYHFEYRNPVISRFWKYEVFWSEFILDEEPRALHKILRNIGLFSFYSKHYARTELAVERWRRIMNPEEFRQSNEDIEKEFFDTHMWESVWYRDFGRKTLSGYEEDTYRAGSYANPRFALKTGERAWFRPKFEGREHLYELALINRQHLSARALQVDKSVGVVSNLYGRINSSQLNDGRLGGLNNFVLVNSAVLNFLNGLVFRVPKTGLAEHSLLQQKVLRSIKKAQNWFIYQKPKIFRREVRIDLKTRGYRVKDSPKLRFVVRMLIDFSIFDFIRTGFARHMYSFILRAGRVRAGDISLLDSFIETLEATRHSRGLLVALETVAAQNFQSFFFSKLIRFGFFGFNKKLRIDGYTETTGLDIVVGQHFSLFSALEGSVVPVFSNFPLFNYLSKWKIEFSGFFEFPEVEKFSRPDRGRFGRFKFVNPRILVNNETSPKINYFLVNFNTWKYENTAPRVRHASKFNYFKNYFWGSRFLRSDYLVSKYFSNLCLLNSFLNNFSSGYAASFNEYFFNSTLLMERPLITGAALPFSYVPSPAVYKFGNVPFGLVDYQFFFNFDNAFFNVRRTISHRVGLTGLDIPISYMYTTADSNYLDFYIFNTFYSQILSRIPAGIYFNKFAHKKFRRYRFKFPAFYPIFGHGFNDGAILHKPPHPSIFSRLRFNYGSTIISSVFKKNKISYPLFLGVKYSISRDKKRVSWYAYFRRFLLYRGFRVSRHIFSGKQFMNYFFIAQSKKGGLNPRFCNLSGSPARPLSVGVVFRKNWIYKWNLKFFYPTGRKSRTSYFSLRLQSRVHGSFVDRTHVSFFRSVVSADFRDMNFYSSLGPVSEFLFDFMISSQSKSIYYFWFRL